MQGDLGYNAALAQRYAALLERMRMWAELPEKTLENLGAAVGDASAPLEIDVGTLALVIENGTDVSEANKLSFFRREVASIMALLPNSPLNAQSAEPWHAKPLFQLCFELLSQSPSGLLEAETKTILVQAVISFGRDASALIGLLLVGLAAFGWGGQVDSAQSASTARIAIMCMNHAEAYLVSEYVGELSLQQILSQLA